MASSSARSASSASPVRRKRGAEQAVGVGIAGRGAEDLARLPRREPRVLAHQLRALPQRLGHRPARLHAARAYARGSETQAHRADDARLVDLAEAALRGVVIAQVERERCGRTL